MDFRQDFEVSRVSWGWSMNARSKRPYFRVNEFEVLNEGIGFNTFIETTRWFGVKFRFEANRAFKLIETRDRTLYEGRRELSPIDSFIERGRNPGLELVLRISGTF